MHEFLEHNGALFVGAVAMLLVITLFIGINGKSKGVLADVGSEVDTEEVGNISAKYSEKVSGANDDTNVNFEVLATTLKYNSKYNVGDILSNAYTYSNYEIISVCDEEGNEVLDTSKFSYDDSTKVFTSNEPGIYNIKISADIKTTKDTVKKSVRTFTMRFTEI